MLNKFITHLYPSTILDVLPSYWVSERATTERPKEPTNQAFLRTQRLGRLLALIFGPEMPVGNAP